MQPKIVFLDGFTINPGDIDWSIFESIGDFTVYDRTEPEDVLSRAANADILIINKTNLNDTHFAALPNLKLVCVAATGYDVIDVEAARKHNVPVCNCSGYGSKAVAQMTMAHLLNVTNQVGRYAMLNAKGFWTESKDFCCWKEPLSELSNKKVAIVGFGNIGRTFAEMIRPFDVKLYAVSSKSADLLPSDVEKISLEEAFSTCDIVSLHCPLTKNNKEFINAELLSNSRKGLILINTARGKLVNETDIAEALKNNVLGAYCTDVLSTEPPSKDNPILSAPRAFVTPHIAWATTEARLRIVDIITQNIKSFLEGRPQNVVN